MYDYTEARDADIRRYARLGIKVEGEEWITTAVREYCLERILTLMGDVQPERDQEAYAGRSQTFSALQAAVAEIEALRAAVALYINAVGEAEGVTFTRDIQDESARAIIQAIEAETAPF